jgi:hypothetical protein
VKRKGEKTRRETRRRDELEGERQRDIANPGNLTVCHRVLF